MQNKDMDGYKPEDIKALGCATVKQQSTSSRVFAKLTEFYKDSVVHKITVVVVYLFS